MKIWKQKEFEYSYGHWEAAELVQSKQTSASQLV